MHVNFVYDVPCGRYEAGPHPVSEIAWAEVGRGMVLWDATSMPLEMHTLQRSSDLLLRPFNIRLQEFNNASWGNLDVWAWQGGARRY